MTRDQWGRVDNVLLWFVILTALAFVVLAGAGCARAAAPQVVEKVVVRVQRERCAPGKRPLLERVPRPYACVPGKPCTKCLPDEICWDKADGGRLAGNLERLVAWVDEAIATCGKAP